MMYVENVHFDRRQTDGEDWPIGETSGAMETATEEGARAFIIMWKLKECTP